MFSRIKNVLLGLTIALASYSASAQDRLPIVASFSILADMVRILGGVGHPVGAFIGAAVFEFVKLFAAAYLTGAWQMVLGLVLIAMVFLAPRGVSALLVAKRRPA